MNAHSDLTGGTGASPRAHISSSEEVHFQGGWLILVRVAWVVVSLLAIGLFVASIPSYFAFLHVLAPSSLSSPQLTVGDVATLRRMGLSLDFYAWLDISASVVILLAYVLMGAVLFWHKSADRVALLASLSLGLFPIALNSNMVGTLPSTWILPAGIVELLGNSCLALFFLLFPSGRFVPRWSGLLLFIWIAYWTISIFFPDSAANSWLFFVVFPGAVLLLIALQVYRYRHVSTPLQRQQTKWVIAGIAFSFGPLVIGLTLDYTLLTLLFPQSSLLTTGVQWFLDLLLLLFPLSLGLAILRHRLWDIGVLINRTLVYGTLTITLGLIYAGLVIGLQALFRGFLSQTSGVAIVISTLAIAALFQPLRRRLQQLIDRRFYRRKYDATRTLAAFSATLRHEVDLTTLCEYLVTAVEETMQPTHLSLWLSRSEQRRNPSPEIPLSVSDI